MRKTYILLFGTVLLSTSLCLAEETSPGIRNFAAILGPCENVPSADIMSKGRAAFSFNRETGELAYKILLEDINDVTVAHLHLGTSAVNNPPVVNLFTGPMKEGKFSGTISEGIISENEFMRSLKGKPLQALIDRIQAGEVYVHVHTQKFPAGELRGQIQ